MKRKGFNLNWTSVLRERKALHRGDVLLRYIPTCYGRAQAVIRPIAAGELEITVTGQNGDAVTKTIPVKEAN